MGLIECKEVCRSFGEKVALDHVSLDIPEGKIFGLLGPNGAGKTTLIRIINRIIMPDSGVVLFNGSPVTQADVEKIGYLPEERGLYRKMKVGDQAMYFAMLKGMSSREAMSELKKWFEKFGIESWWNKKVEELSKGMAQKVQFITTVAHRPSLLILDEPTVGLDPIQILEIRALIAQLGESRTVLISSHILSEVQTMCSKILIISHGRLVAFDAPDALEARLASPGEISVTAETDAARAKALIADVPGVSGVTVVSDSPERCRLTVSAGGGEIYELSKGIFLAFAGSGAALCELGVRKASLEDIFLELTEHEPAIEKEAESA